MDPFEDEWYAVRYSGEIPEVALHSALHYLTEDVAGPGLVLDVKQYRLLIAAAEARFHEIVLRDLLPGNRTSASYRGVRRSIVNYRRFLTFCRRQQVDQCQFQHEVAATLLLFLVEESIEVQRGRRQSSINCSFDELCAFAVQLGLVGAALPDDLRILCR